MLHIEEQYFKEEGYIEVELTWPSLPGAELGFLKGGGGHHKHHRHRVSRGVWGMLPQKILKIWVSKMAISSILRPISCS